MYKKLNKKSICVFEGHKIMRDKVRICDIQIGDDEWDKPFTGVDEKYFVQRNGEILIKQGNGYKNANVYFNLSSKNGAKCPFRNHLVVAFEIGNFVQFERVDVIVYSAFGDLDNWTSINHVRHLDKNQFNCDIKNLCGLRHNKKTEAVELYSIDKDGNRVDYANIEDAINKTNCSIATIYRALRKKNRTKNGFCFYWGEK